MKELYGYEYSKTCPLVYALTVVGARWKLPIIWYLTEDAEPGYQPKSYTFHESSNLGILEGTIVFQEK